MRQQERLKAEVRKWGHSMGIIIPNKFARKLDLREHEKVEIRFKKTSEIGDIMELFGAVKFKEPTAKIKKEMKEGWDD
jgi:antitoxin component of MazEF toxin-antitoxin module